MTTEKQRVFAGGASEAGGILSRSDGSAIAYHALAGTSPGVVFIHGFRSDMTGNKALVVEEFCRKRGNAFVRFDVTGHGSSSGRFDDGCISQWAADVVSVLDELTEGPQVLVGSSMGGWLMLLAALQRRPRIAGLLGLAAAPDFTEELVWAEFSEDERRTLVTEGRVLLPDCFGEQPHFPITRRLIEDGRNNLLFPGPIALDVPVRLIHGQQDEDVPWRTALRIQEALISDDVEVAIVKSSGHRLSEPHDLERMQTVLDELLRTVEAKGL